MCQRERAQAGGDRLLVADVGEDGSEHRQRTNPARRGCADRPAPSARSSPAVFSATVLPPVFGPVMSSAVAGGSIMMSTGTGARATPSTSSRSATRRRASAADGAPPAARAGRPVETAGAMPSGDLRRTAPSPAARRARSPLRSLRCRSSARSRKRVGQREQDAVDLFGLLLLERDDVVVDLDGASGSRTGWRRWRSCRARCRGCALRCSALTRST